MRQVPISPPAEGDQSPQKAVVLIDTDIDDALALALALASPKLEVYGDNSLGRQRAARTSGCTAAARLLAPSVAQSP